MHKKKVEKSSSEHCISSSLAVHPGEFLQETIEELKISQAELANRLGKPVQTVDEIIKGKKDITEDFAQKLEKALGVPSYIWTGLQNEYEKSKHANR